MFGDAGGAGVFFYDTLDGTGSEATIIAGGVNRVDVTRIIEEEGGEGIVAHGKVIADAVGGGLRDKNGAVFLTFATDEEFATVEVNGIAIEGDELGNTETTRKK